MAAGTMGIVALVIAGACALANPPSDDSAPPHGGLPQGVTAAPAGTQVGPVTTPMPAGSDPTPAPALAAPRGLRDDGARAFTDTTTRMMSARLDTVIGSLSRGITDLPVPVARGVVQGISASLRDSRAARVRAVSVELDSLNTLLGASTIDGHAIGHSLLRLSARSSAAAPEAGILAGRVARLADQLEEVGKKLAGQKP